MKNLMNTLGVTMLLATAFKLHAQEVVHAKQQICDITSENSKEIRKQTRESILSLQKRGRIHLPANKLVPDTSANKTLAGVSNIRLKWPLKSKDAEEYAYLGSKNFLDMDTTFTIDSNGDTTFNMKDYEGGDHTYNGHNGMDIIIAPYWWERKKKGNVYAVASAPGIIVQKRDGGFDGNCSWNNPPWVGAGASGNFIGVLHSDNSTITYYKHLKNGSLTSKDLGDYVNAGEYIGVIASSGRSTAPHLHFEVHVGWQDASNDGTLVEPFMGPENYTTGGVSLWENQPAYIEPDICSMETHTATSEFDYPDTYSSDCDSTVILTTLSNGFALSKWVSFSTAFRDFVSGNKVSFFVLDPNGSLKGSWTYDNVNLYRFVTYRHNIFVPSNATEGTWSYNLAFNGKTYSHFFTVGTCDASRILTGSHSGNDGFITSNYISSTATISGSSNNSVRYKADSYVRLNVGFTASAGCTFIANTEGCVNGK